MQDMGQERYDISRRQWFFPKIQRCCLNFVLQVEFANVFLCDLANRFQVQNNSRYVGISLYYLDAIDTRPPSNIHIFLYFEKSKLFASAIAGPMLTPCIECVNFFISSIFSFDLA